MLCDFNRWHLIIWICNIGNLIFEIRQGREDDFLDADERIRIKEQTCNAVREIEQILEAAGMEQIDNRHYAGADNLDEYFKSATLGRITDIPEDAE
ncbi:MAG: hypothetical protein PVI06_17450 [Desulfobacterales bacterium]|jgi:hypothetical protein